MPVKSAKRKVQSAKIQVKTPASAKALAGEQKVETTKRRVASKADGTSRAGLSVDVYDTKGKVVGKTSLPKDVFAAKINPALMAQAVRVYLSNQRKGGASTKTRGEISGGGRKPWRQKGTGRARAGSIRSPLWVGGGIVFGPKPRDYSLSLPKKMKKRALTAALTSKFKERAIKVVEGLDKLTPKTKVMYTALNALSQNAPFSKVQGKKVNPSAMLRARSQKVLLVTPGKLENVQRAARNIEAVTIRPVNLLNTYEILNSNTILFMEETIEKLKELWSKETS